jgi:hypothetical protein
MSSQASTAPGPARLAAVMAAVLTATVVPLVLSGVRGDATERPTTPVVEHEGRAPTAVELVPSVEAAFGDESYAPRTTATLVLTRGAPGVTLRIFRVGPERRPTRGNNEMVGVPVTKARLLGDVRPGARVSVEVGAWPSGLYFAKLRSSNRLIGFAPFVVRPAALGTSEVAVVLPTRTWQAYNLRDDDGDGFGNSWYARWKIRSVALGRPFLNRGVPYHFRLYELPYLRWLDRTHKRVDYLSDADLEAVPSGTELARAYKLVIFPGHHEYVTTKQYDVVTQYRDRGGNLMFLYANNFFWQVVKHDDRLERTTQWRDLDRPEAALVGVQYRASNSGARRRPWIVRAAPANFWLLAGTSLNVGSQFGLGGVEIDATTTDSPRGTQVLAEIPDLFGPGYTAQMTYYESAQGAKVFAAGAFTLVALPIEPPIAQMLDNLWAHLTADPLPGEV